MTQATMHHRLGDHVCVLHNSGPSPMSVYKTAAVGLVWRVQPRTLIGELMAHHGIEGDHPCWEKTLAENILHPRVIDLAVCAAIVLLDSSGVRAEGQPEAAAEARALIMRETRSFVNKDRSLGPRSRAGTKRAVQRLLTLRDILDACGALPPFVGITEWASEDGADQPRPYPWLPVLGRQAYNPEALSMAWGLLALAHYARPVLLFRRIPTFDGFCCSGALVLRWFGTVPSPEAS